MSLTWKYATKDDAELMADLSRQTFFEAFANENSEEDMQLFLDQQFTKGKLMLEVGAPENIFILAFNDNEVAGYVKLKDGKKPDSLNGKNAMEIARLYARKNMIGKGVGNLLMQLSINEAKEKGKEVVWLGVWERNERAIQFYTKWGFEKFGEQDFVLGNDVQNDWLMKKDIR